MKLNRPRGTRDFLPEENARRWYAESTLRKVAEHWGYNEIKTPTFEHVELFTIKSGEGILGEIYNFRDKGDREVALRPELTAPVMRLYVEELQKAPKPLRFYYCENCFRYENPQKGRFREFWQFGVEAIGSARPEADAEVIALAAEMLRSLGIVGDLHVGHLGIIRHLLRELDSEQQSRILRLVDKKDDKGLESYLNETNAGDSLSASLFHLVGLRGGTAIEEARSIVGDIDAIGQLDGILKLLDAYGVGYTVDFGIARGLDYYTGMVFEIYGENLGAQSQVCGGGSYRLAHLFGGEDIPSTGYAIGFDRVMEILDVSIPKKIKAAVIYFDDTRTEAIQVAQELRKCVPAYIDIMGRKFKDQLSFASTSGAAYAVIVGKTELDEGKLTLKNMITKEQEKLTLEQVIARVTAASPEV